MEGDKYLKRLKKIPIWAFVALFTLTLPIFITQIILIRESYIPRLLLPLKKLQQPELVDRLSTGFDKILLHLSVTGLGFFVMIILLIYILWNMRKFFQFLKQVK